MIGNLAGVLFDGIAYGSLLFIISIGLSVTMGLMNFVNLAHGAFAMVGGYDGMHLIYEAAKKAGPNATGEQLVEAMKGMKWVSPRGPMSIDPATRQTIQNVYMREVKMVNGKPWNIEFDKVENVKDPAN